LPPIIELAQREKVSIIEASTPRRPDITVEGSGQSELMDELTLVAIGQDVVNKPAGNFPGMRSRLRVRA
jgi:hypothetical protein